MRISELAQAAGVTVQTVRYYERRRLLIPPSRRPSGYRVFGQKDLRRLRFIKNAQALGFTLTEIQDLLTLRVSSSARCADVRRKAVAKLDHVRGKIRDLQALAGALQGLIRACRVGEPTDRCPILEGMERSDNAKAVRG